MIRLRFDFGRSVNDREGWSPRDWWRPPVPGASPRQYLSERGWKSKPTAKLPGIPPFSSAKCLPACLNRQ